MVTEPGWFLAQSLPQTHKTVAIFFMTPVAHLREITPVIAVAVSIQHAALMCASNTFCAWLHFVHSLLQVRAV